MSIIKNNINANDVDQDYQNNLSSDEEDINQEVMLFGEESCDDDLCSIESIGDEISETDEEEFDEYDYSSEEDDEDDSERNTSTQTKEPIIIYLEPIPCVTVWPQSYPWTGYGSSAIWPTAFPYQQFWPHQFPTISYKIAKVTKPNRVKNHRMQTINNNSRILSTQVTKNNTLSSSSCIQSM